MNHLAVSILMLTLRCCKTIHLYNIRPKLLYRMLKLLWYIQSTQKASFAYQSVTLMVTASKCVLQKAFSTTLCSAVELVLPLLFGVFQSSEKQHPLTIISLSMAVANERCIFYLFFSICQCVSFFLCRVEHRQLYLTVFLRLSFFALDNRSPNCLFSPVMLIKKHLFKRAGSSLRFGTSHK